MLWNRLQFLREVFRSDDPMTVDLGQAGEQLTAKIRLTLIAAVGIIPLKSTIVEPHRVENWVGLSVATMAMTLSVGIVYLASLPRPPRRLAWFTTQFDVFMVTLGGVGFILSGRPIVATNNFVHFSIYLLALGATALRADPIVSIVAGVSAGVQHIVVVIVASRLTLGLSDPDYGRFSWDNQVGRLILIMLGTLLAAALVHRNRTYWHSSVRDKLTGLHNRRFFDEFLDYKIAECRRHERRFSLVFMDIDNFKKINDHHGHTLGDAVLMKTGSEVSGFFRDSDLAARYGGEEFTLILPESDLGGIERRLVEFQGRLHGLIEEFKITVSIGVAAFPADGITAAQLIRAADERMYRAKNDGRNRVVVKDEG